MGGGGGRKGLGVCGLLSFLSFFSFFTKTKFTSKKVVLNEYEICLKLLQMAILETQIFKNFWGSMPPNPPRKLTSSALVVIPSFEGAESALDLLEISHAQQFFNLGISGFGGAKWCFDWYFSLFIKVMNWKL